MFCFIRYFVCLIGMSGLLVTCAMAQYGGGNCGSGGGTGGSTGATGGSGATASPALRNDFQFESH